MRPIRDGVYISSSSRFGIENYPKSLLTAKFLLSALKEVPKEEAVEDSYDRCNHDDTLIDSIWDQLYGELYCELEDLHYHAQAVQSNDGDRITESIQKLLDRLEFIRIGK